MKEILISSLISTTRFIMMLHFTNRLIRGIPIVIVLSSQPLCRQHIEYTKILENISLLSLISLHPIFFIWYSKVEKVFQNRTAALMSDSLECTIVGIHFSYTFQFEEVARVLLWPYGSRFGISTLVKKLMEIWVPLREETKDSLNDNPTNSKSTSLT